MTDARDVRKNVSLEVVEELVETGRRLGRRQHQPLAKLVRRRRAHDRAGRLNQAVDEHVDGAVAQLAHRLRVEGERRALHRATLRECRSVRACA